MTARSRFAASPGRLVLAALALELAVCLVLALAGAADRLDSEEDRDRIPRLAERLQLTGLSLWSSASYCRHPSQADVFSAHGEHPAAPDHFPEGSIVSPPPGNPAGAARTWGASQP